MPLAACGDRITPTRYRKGDRSFFEYSRYSAQPGRACTDPWADHLSNALGDNKGSCRVEKAQCLTASRTRNFERGNTRGLRSRVSRTRRTNADIMARTTRPRARRNG